MKNGLNKQKIQEPTELFPDIFSGYQHHAKTTQSKLNSLQEEINRFTQKISVLEEQSGKKEFELTEKEKTLKELRSQKIKKNHHKVKSSVSAKFEPQFQERNNQKNVLKLCSLQSINTQLREEISNLRIEKAMFTKINNSLQKEIHEASADTKYLIERAQKSEEMEMSIKAQAQNELKNLDQNNQIAKIGMITMKNQLESLNKQSKTNLKTGETLNLGSFLNNKVRKTEKQFFGMSIANADKRNASNMKDVSCPPLRPNEKVINKENNKKMSRKTIITQTEAGKSICSQHKDDLHLTNMKKSAMGLDTSTFRTLQEKDSILKSIANQKNQLIGELNELKSFFSQLFKETTSSSVSEVIQYYNQMEDEKGRLYMENQHLSDQLKKLKEHKAAFQNELQTKQMSLIKKNEFKDAITGETFRQNREIEEKIKHFETKKQEINQIVTSLKMALPIILDRLIAVGGQTHEESQFQGEEVPRMLFELENKTNKILKSLNAKKIEENVIVMDKEREGEKRGMNNEVGKESLNIFEETVSEVIRV